MKIPSRVQKSLTTLAVLFFLYGVFYSFLEIKDFGFRVWTPQALVLVFLSVPIMLHLSIRRFQVVTRIYTTRYSYRGAARTVVYGAVANMLPVPGAFMVRVASIANRVGMKKAIFANVLAYFVWIMVSALFAVALCAPFFLIVSVSFSLLIAFLLMSYFVKRTEGHRGSISSLIVVQSLLSVCNIIRLFLISYCFNSVVGLDTAALIQLSGVVVSGVGIVPSGIGLAEGLAAAISAMSGELAAVGFAVVATNRLLTWLGLLVAVALIKTDRSFDVVE